MQVQPVQSSMYNSHAHPPSRNQHYSHTNGSQSDTSQYYSTSTNGHLEEGDMYPYHQSPYGPGYGQPPHRQLYHQANQLPPMYPGGGAPPPMAPAPGPGMGQGENIAQPTQHSAETENPLPSAGNTRREGSPKSQTGNNGRYKFELVVEQQPQRARMCGFGDKDRRPITPPPCVRLIITDIQTGKKLGPADDVDGMFFVLQVDLWDENATREVNIVRSSSSAPSASISMATTTSFPPTPLTPQPMDQGYPPGMYQAVPMQPVYGQPYMAMGHPPMYGPPVPPGHPVYAHPSFYNGPQHYGPTGAMVPAPYPSPSFSQAQQHTSAQLNTRNLIGSVTVNASQLKDTDDELGFWFVLQDLSIRTEGWFRLRCSFIDVGNLDGSGRLNKGRAPVLAYVFSEKFQVFSAKKFPGVIESTPISKKFAAQGIKIPIRKGEGKGGADEDDAE